MTYGSEDLNVIYKKINHHVALRKELAIIITRGL
jgi:hypothetical protein